MPFLDLPPQMQERVVCSITAAVKYEVPANIVLAVAEQEAGKPGQWVENTNGTQDVGPMQFNTAYLAELRKYGITAQDVARGGCYSYDLAAWRLRGHLRNDQGDIWTRAANYHSRTPQYNSIYRASLIKRAGKWENWLVARFPTFDATQPGKPVVAAVATADATPGAGQGAAAPPTPVPAVAAPAQPVQGVKASMPARHYNTAAAAALAAVFAPASLKQGGSNGTALAREP
ncbi:transglycosylase SLT domain-containing protein [Burkholderia ambifaria]|uniref:transglycosylase SLT domain-containing protein n=1 Tax=Burkholderia ambifaria TaxID=152480 RepID=UPI00158E3498|nr:transglycosylase SLT domain-containing protein [Burkholderia ambifaria]